MPKKQTAAVETATAPRRRASSKDRQGRTYYAIDKEGTNIFRFATHANRLQAMQANKLKELGALEFRDFVADGKHNLIDTRKPGPHYMPDVIEAPPQPKQAQVNGNSLDMQTLTASIVKAVTKSLRGAGVALENLQPSSNRLTADH